MAKRQQDFMTDTPDVAVQLPYGPPSLVINNITSADHDKLLFDDFDEGEGMRKQFVRKVYGILSCQLLFTTAVIAICMYCDPVTMFCLQYGRIIYPLGALLLLILIFVFIFSVNARRVWPTNFILLFMFTAVKAITLGVLSAFYERTEILMAAGVTILICCAITAFAFQTKWDFTFLTGSCLIIPIILLFIIVGVILQLLVSSLIYATLGITFFSFLLLYRTQMIISGTHRYKFSPEEYIFAALVLYVDIVAIFTCSARAMR